MKGAELVNKSKLIEKPEYRSLISANRNSGAPVYSWLRYKHSFSKELVQNLISEFDLKSGDWVLDPFCGGGTTLLTCKENGINSLGIDVLPFAVFLTNAKTDNYKLQELYEGLEDLKTLLAKGKNLYASLPDISYIKKAFNPEIEKKLLQIKGAINRIENAKAQNFFNLAFLSILENVSNTTKAGGFLRIRERNINPEQVEIMLFTKIDSMIADLNLQRSKNGIRKGNAKAKLGDSRNIATKREFDAVITSPPYPNRHDYTRIYSLELAFDFISSNDEMKKLRYDTLRSHVEARKRYEVENYEQPIVLQRLLRLVERNGTNNSKVLPMLEGYFEDMYISLTEMHRCLKKNGQIGLVVSNVRFAGVNIPVDEILAELGENTGLKTTGIWAARVRGNSPQQMGKYQKASSRESIVIWKK